ncbi:cob(I)yrinic acid a,c-diamide adenosyltransferase [Calderihabitans maritimus]|uniref:Cob(I)yrinic acid a,c-diamide adenosyltransferase n=1 Tax=Calderihabitans maritimus TaxID=1246530 RepID=A0A1Z5HXG5_9FIRM|nr:cob(I)yrinic acid a,c-diamide adenosyltransferase [Calderihabitans maritimus]GAW94226.1 cob(I)yrinic acid a,c-diamide adenosyltransferase [Calderihabitans maritimus]
MKRLEKGLIQVYTGNGKGKSTAAFGLAVRAAGHGFKVYIIQFMKTGNFYGEINTFKRLAPEVEVKSFGRPGFIYKESPREEDYKLAREALEYARQVMLADDADIVILDEINNALYFGLISLEEVMELLKQKPPQVELVLTGRNAPMEIIEMADLVTEMLEKKHPYRQGIPGRKGIEY